jgi:hypothetical protein
MGGFLKALLVIGVAFALFTFPATWLLMSMVRTVVGGVDTHADVHVAAAVESNGGVLGIESFPTDTAGYRALAGWRRSVRCSVSGWRVPIRMGSVCPGSSMTSMSTSSRSIERTGRPVARRAALNTPPNEWR